ncbi:hypothetical protein JB92DRAFT_2825064 [Gautieria morchelliformis]|nr:hypothetical protein JB92DRAFT_2825064 [Gautieria morchelliformis]
MWVFVIWGRRYWIVGLTSDSTQDMILMALLPRLHGVKSLMEQTSLEESEEMAEFLTLIEDFHTFRHMRPSALRLSTQRQFHRAHTPGAYAMLRPCPKAVLAQGNIYCPPRRRPSVRYLCLWLVTHVPSPEPGKLDVVLRDEVHFIADLKTHSAKQTRVSDDLWQKLVTMTVDCQEARRLEMEALGQLMGVISEKEMLSRSLEDACTRERDLESQLSAAREELESGKRELHEAHEEMDRQLKAEAAEADRVLRDVIVEADGDHAVLKHQLFGMRAVRQLKETKAGLDVLNADVAGLHEELQNARAVEGILNDDLGTMKGGISGYKTCLEDSERLAKGFLQAATAFRDSHCKAFTAAQTSSSTSKSVANLADSATLFKSYMEPVASAAHSVGMGTTIWKWQKQCKEYHDRAKGKISFRNFAKGDLALFLPTQNSTLSPGWHSMFPQTSAPMALPGLEMPVPVARHFVPRQRTHSAPAPHASSLTLLVAQGTESTSPSPLLGATSYTRPISPNTSRAAPPSPLGTSHSPVSHIEQSHGLSRQSGGFDPRPSRDTRSALEKLINRMDGLEATFDKMAEKTRTCQNLRLLSIRAVVLLVVKFGIWHEFMRVGTHRLAKQQIKSQDAHYTTDQLTASSKSSWCSYKSCRMQRGNKSDGLVNTGTYCKQAETERQLRDIHGQAAEEKKRVDQLEVELHTTSTLEDREAQLLADMENQQNALAEAQTRSA